MIDFKKILFPVDLSTQSREVVPSVAAMAKRFNSEVVILHVTSATTPEPAFDTFAADALSGIRVIRELVQGDPASQIINYAAGQKIDLIMMPAHGHGPFRSLILGSVTAKVLHDVHCPVWTGIHAEEMTVHSPARWKRITCAVDTDVETEEHSTAVLKWASEFAQQQSLELELFHAVAGADGMWTEASDPSMYDFLFHAAREQLAKLQTAAGTNLKVRLMGGSVGSAVRQAAIEYDADLVVIGRGGTAILHAAPCPVISI